jgi:hypothetical protein
MRVVSTRGLGVNSLKVLVTGESGSGKTTLIGGTGERVCIISAEAGLLALAHKDITVIDITQDDAGTVLLPGKRIARLREALMWLYQPEQRAKFDWVALDSLTEISQYLIAELVEKYPERKDSLVMYGENKSMMRGLIKAFRDLPYYNVLFTCLPNIDKDADGRRVYELAVVGSIASEIPAMFDEVFFLQSFEVGKDEGGNAIYHRRLITGNIPMIKAKDRSRALDLYEDVTDPDTGFARVISKIRARMAGDAAPEEKKFAT